MSVGETTNPNIEMEKNKDGAIDKDTFWYDDMYILFDDLQSFYPTEEMDFDARLNAIMRMAIYAGVILTLLTANYLFLFIPIGVSLFTITLYNKFRTNFENFFSEVANKQCTVPTDDNPFMNFNQITDDRCRTPACASFNNTLLKKDIEEKFQVGLYRDATDIYGKENNQREYYTMPCTTAVNDQTAFAKWCYETGPTCKENGIKCAPEYSYTNPQQVFAQQDIK